MVSIQLSIADPCHENWNNMLPEDKGRFCLSCQKTVVDFTNMNDGQVFDYFKNYTGSICGQFAPKQLNRNIAKPKAHSIGRWKYFWQIMLPAVFAFHKVEGQTKKWEIAAATVCKADTAYPNEMMLGKVSMPSNYKVPKYSLQGIVFNEKQEPLPFATIVSESGKGTMADGSGHFSIEILPGNNLTFSSVGYENKKFSYDSLKPAAIKHLEVSKRTNTILIETTIQSKQEAVNPNEIVVIGGGIRVRRRVIGGTISSITKSTLFQHETKLDNSLPALKIFPNPIRPGQSFQISLQTKKTGNYLLRIADASGKVMLEEKLSINRESQMETINGNTLQQAGIYFLQISKPGDRKGNELTGRIVVQ